MLEMICDRCGKRQKGDGDRAKMIMRRRYDKTPLSKGKSNEFYADLCWDCEYELVDWFEGVQKVISSVGISPDEFHSICEEIVEKLKESDKDEIHNESDSDQTINNSYSESKSIDSIIFGDEVLKPENSKPEKYVATIPQEDLKDGLLPMDEPASCF